MQGAFIGVLNIQPVLDILLCGHLTKIVTWLTFEWSVISRFEVDLQCPDFLNSGVHGDRRDFIVAGVKIQP